MKWKWHFLSEQWRHSGPWFRVAPLIDKGALYILGWGRWAIVLERHPA